MKSNQSLHITIKEPPNPEPVRTIGIFDDLDAPSLPSIVSAFLAATRFDPKSSEFQQNVKDEVLALLTKEKVVAVRREADVTIVYLTRN